jgi:hypothetical protein
MEAFADRITPAQNARIRGLDLGFMVNEFYKKGCQEKSSASTGGRDSFSRSSPLKFRFSVEVWLVVQAREFLC